MVSLRARDNVEDEVPAPVVVAEPKDTRLDEILARLARQEAERTRPAPAPPPVAPETHSEVIAALEALRRERGRPWVFTVKRDTYGRIIEVIARHG